MARGGEDFTYAVTEVINNLSLRGAENYFAPIVDEVEKAKANYGKVLRATYIGKETLAPVFGSREENWQELSKRWRQRKNQRGDMKNYFYKGLGSGEKSLAHALYFMPGEKLFGKTTLRTRIEQSKTSNPNRGRIQTVYRDDYGRFARPNPKALQNIRVTVNPFPNVQMDDQALIKSLPISPANKRKLFYNSEKRPLIEPYTEWFFERKVRSRIIELAQRLR